nr:class I SAM-dependent methyltransferase [Roseospira visakhapatnamensis]
MFDAVAPRYDSMNDIMSFGVHRLWKRRLRRMAGPPRGRGLALDLAGGTGDIADLMADKDWAVAVCDPSTGMIDAGRKANAGPRLRWVAGAGEALPFADRTFDVVTLGFGLRNMTDRRGALTEVLRVLVPGGTLLCLEFSTPWRLIRPAYEGYSRRMIPRLGAAVAGQPDAYRYLVDSIGAFPDQKTLAGWLRDAGFATVRYRNLFMGIAAIHSGTRPA